MPFDLPAGEPGSLGLDPTALDRLVETIERQIAEGWYPGAEIAIARNGRFVMTRGFGNARVAPEPVKVDDRTLWLLYSNTKVITAAAIWQLVERGKLRFTDTVAKHLPGFEKNAKREITVLQAITHQGGFPDAVFRAQTWEDQAKRREAACDIALQWTPGSRVSYHPLAAHWVLAALIESITGRDFKDVIRQDLLEPLGLADEIFVGLPEDQHARAVDMHAPHSNAKDLKPVDENNSALWRRAGAPGGGGYASARGMAAFYQMLLQGGTLNGVRVLSPAVIRYATRNFTGDRVDHYVGMPMHRGLGPHLRGTTPTIRGLGSLATPTTFGHGGVGSSYCWADPESGVSFAYLTNSRQPDPWHSDRLDTICNFVHSAIVG